MTDASVAKDDEILLAREGAIATITFNRPQRLNAFRLSTYERLHRLIGQLEGEPDVRVVILTGSGRAFCAGEDLQELETNAARGLSEAELTRSLLTLQDITRQIVNSSRVYLAAVNGVAAGFGAELAIACDIRFFSDTARLMFPEVRRGLFITNGVTVLLQRLVGQGRAKELLLTGLPIDAPRALAIGLANHVLAPDVLLPQCVAMGVAIAENAPLSVERTKRIVHESADRDLEFALAKEVEYAIECFREGAHEEGARAFFDKRPPHFVRKDAGTP